MITDNDVGEDFLLEDKVPARGTRVTLMRPVPEPPLRTFLDQEGCLTFESQYAYGHKLVVYADAWVGHVEPGPPDPVQLRVGRQEMDGGNYETDFFWIVDVDEIAPNSVVEVSFEWQKTDPIVPIMAVATEVLHRFAQLEVLPPEPTGALLIVFRDWYGGALFFGPNNVVPGSNMIRLGPDSYQEKYVIAHEMGHWLQYTWGTYLNAGLGYGYGNDDDNMGDLKPDPPCKFKVSPPMNFSNPMMPIGTNANTHGIRSAEWSVGAMEEGFAHFIASATFNDAEEDGIFRYYKDINTEFNKPHYDAFVAADLKVSLYGGTNVNTLGGKNRWTDSMCTNDWAEPGVSSEIDWLRFFWHYWTRSGTSPTLPEILEFFAWVVDENYAIDDTNVGTVLRTALGESQWSSFGGRFEQANCDMGAYNENTCP